MRYIDIALLEQEIPDEWKEKAREACKAVKNAPTAKERSEKIDEYSSLWRDLKDLLKKLSHGKCWYCESAGHRILGDVDHHRPKNKIKHYLKYNGPEHKGYWWLAFEWKNYRYACELCNRLNKDHTTGVVGGKGSYFPLVDEEKRVYDECNPYQLLQEVPLLLDPTVETDPFLITFVEDGSAQSASDDPVEKKRVEASIRLYHLNHYDVKERRRLNICHMLHDKVQTADKFYWYYDQNKTDIAAREGYRGAIKDLKYMISERAEYSAAARAILKLYRTPARRWVDDLLTAS